MSGVVDFIFGGQDTSAQQLQAAANRAASENIAERTAQARADVLNIIPRGDVARNLGFQGALDVLSQTIPQQLQTFQGGNVGAQQNLLAGLPQIQNAILGGQVDLSALQPTRLPFDPSFATQGIFGLPVGGGFGGAPGAPVGAPGATLPGGTLQGALSGVLGPNFSDAPGDIGGLGGAAQGSGGLPIGRNDILGLLGLLPGGSALGGVNAALGAQAGAGQLGAVGLDPTALDLFDAAFGTNFGGRGEGIGGLGDLGRGGIEGFLNFADPAVAGARDIARNQVLAAQAAAGDTGQLEAVADAIAATAIEQGGLLGLEDFGGGFGALGPTQEAQFSAVIDPEFGGLFGGFSGGGGGAGGGGFIDFGAAGETGDPGDDAGLGGEDV